MITGLRQTPIYYKQRNVERKLTNTEQFMRQDKPEGSVCYMIWKDCDDNEACQLKCYIWRLHTAMISFQHRYKTAFTNAYNN